jgi:cytochrome d ubiquinol oxidase subunit II
MSAAGEYSGDYVADWITPLSVYSGFFAVGLCAYLAAVYLIREAELAGAADLVALWRQRAMLVGVVAGVLSAAGLAYVASAAPVLWDGFRSRAWPLVLASAAVGLFSLMAVWCSWHRIAVAGAATTVATVVWGWGVAQYPLIIPPSLDMDSVKAPAAVLRALVWSIAGGSVLLAPSLWLLFSLFKGKRPDEVG